MDDLKQDKAQLNAQHFVLQMLLAALPMPHRRAIAEIMRDKADAERPSDPGWAEEIDDILSTIVLEP